MGEGARAIVRSNSPVTGWEDDMSVNIFINDEVEKTDFMGGMTRIHLKSGECLFIYNHNLMQLKNEILWAYESLKRKGEDDVEVN